MSMTIIDIENMTTAELKAQRDAAVEAAGGGELAARYVQARLDAKARDEKLAEQGATITSLNAAVEMLTGQLKEATAKVEAQSKVILDREKNVRVLESAARDSKAAFDSKLEAVQIERNAESGRANTAESLAKARRAALVAVMQFASELNTKVAPLLAAE